MSALDELIYDRTQADVTYAAELNRKLGRGEALTSQELADWDAGLKGTYNATDMNRVDAAVRELGGLLTEAGYVVQYTSPLLNSNESLNNLMLKSVDFQQAPYLYATGIHDTQYADDYISTKSAFEVSAGVKLYVTTNVVLLQDSGFIWYDKSKAFISGAKSEEISEYAMSAIVPQTAKYCNININSAGVTPQSITTAEVLRSTSEPQKTEFEIGDIITYDIWRIYLTNVQSIRDAYYVMTGSPELPEPTATLTFDGANAIEKLLYDISQLYDAMVASYRPCGAFKCGNNAQHLPLQRSVI